MDPYSDPVCAGADLNFDTFVDMYDFNIFQGCFTGPGVAADPACVP